MSNPGVIILKKTRKNLISRIFNRHSYRTFQIEDNIGESIHIHYDDIRIELSIKDFLYFSNIIKKSLNKLIDLEYFDCEKIDPLFLQSISESGLILKLSKIKIEKIDLNKVKFIDYLLGGLICNLSYAKKLNYNVISNKKHYKYHYIDNLTFNKKAYLETENKIFYPIIDEDDVIRDGKHRLLYLFSKNVFEIQAQRWIFEKKSKYKINTLKYSAKNLFFYIFDFIKRNIKDFIIKIRNFFQKNI